MNIFWIWSEIKNNNENCWTNSEMRTIFFLYFSTVYVSHVQMWFVNIFFESIGYCETYFSFYIFFISWSFFKCITFFQFHELCKFMNFFKSNDFSAWAFSYSLTFFICEHFSNSWNFSNAWSVSNTQYYFKIRDSLNSTNMFWMHELF